MNLSLTIDQLKSLKCLNKVNNWIYNPAYNPIQYNVIRNYILEQKVSYATCDEVLFDVIVDNALVNIAINEDTFRLLVDMLVELKTSTLGHSLIKTGFKRLLVHVSNKRITALQKVGYFPVFSTLNRVDSMQLIDYKVIRSKFPRYYFTYMTLLIRANNPSTYLCDELIKVILSYCCIPTSSYFGIYELT